MAQEQETCRLCPKGRPETGTWICCDVCETWYHVRCLKLSVDEFEAIDQYHCADCEPKAGPSTLLRKSSRRTGKINYADLVNGIVSHHDKWRVLLDSHQFLPDKFIRIEGKDLTLDWLRSTGFKTPVVVKGDPDGAMEGLGMAMPPKSLTVDDVRDAVGADTPVEVIDVATQSELLDWDMGTWAEYFKAEPKERVYNVISLEISGTPLAAQIRRPNVVRELDWIENFWPKELQATEFPKVQLYCLMSVKDSFTDFHIDFAGSSVFYHILSGSKTFFFVEPTSTHLRKYAKWSSSSEQSTTFFGDEVAGKCHKVELKQGDTMLIPAGWIHAVYTPSSSVVIGGNFIHSLHIPMQFRVCDIEMETDVSPKFRFPFFEKLNWFVALGCVERGSDYLSTLSSTELSGLLVLTVHLYNRQKKLKNETAHLIKEERHMIRASIPAEVSSYSKGGSLGLLRELNWTVISLLEERLGASSSATDVTATTTNIIEPGLRLPSEEAEREEEQRATEAEKNKPKIKLRIKLSSPTSPGHSGDEDCNHGEQQVPASAAPNTGDAPKLKFKIPLVSGGNKSYTNSSSQQSRKSKVPGTEFESGSEQDDSGDDITGLDQHLTSDEEWNEIENQIDEGFDEAKEEEEELDDGMLDLKSSDSEYDVGTRKVKRARLNRKRTGSTSKTVSGTPSTTSKMASAAQSVSRPRVKRPSTETVYFDDIGEASPEYSSPQREESDEEEVVLGLGKKRKLTPLQFSKLIAGPTTSSSNSSSTAPKKKAVCGGTAKDRIKSLLLKRR
ncbi:hypothetical protein B0O80DRAFT_476084 [Mortierella sp. GBAus27b]|nr:JmjC domain-containing histone demethylation protein 1 [Mortierella sp. GBA43]KAI8345011.1 hypothetical protein B0O80DRAFT_476084 [Mortierella sp. GBAus27b]